MVTIVIDPGHGGDKKVGGSDPNHAKGPSGLLEKTITLDIAKRAAKILEGSGHTVVLTRSTDVNLGLAARAKVVMKLKAPVFVSVHFNGFNGITQGTETFCHLQHWPQSSALCRSVQVGAVGATGLKDRNSGAPEGVKTQALGVLNPNSHYSKTACVLVEISFMDVPAEDARLNTAPYKDQIASGLASGIVAYLAEQPVDQFVVLAGPELQDGFEALAKTIPAKRKRPAKGAA
ncbi:MAG: N-acetylmuramoyl-L-alanine amidase family protein [Roseiarcus sp.]